MRRRLIALLVAGCLLAAIVGVWSPGLPGGGSEEEPLPVAELSTSELAGQMAVMSYRGTVPPRELISRIRRGEAAGVIFFAANIESREQLARVTARLQQAAGQAPNALLSEAPLLLMADQEGGGVRRLAGAPERSQLEIGRAAGSGELAAQAGAQAAANLAGGGLNVNLAPVLGVERPPLGEGLLGSDGRTYGSSPQEVGELAAQFISAQQEGGVAATAKHFPGLGAADADEHTDLRPVTLSLSAQTLRDIDMAPYADAIEAEVRLVMTSHATYPELDPSLPATFSRAILEDELRGRLGFPGVIVTDALEAPALDRFGDVSARSRLAAAAGADLLLYSAQDVRQGAAGHRALVEGLESGELDRAPLEQAAERVLRLRLDLVR